MARARSLKPKFFTNDKLAQLPPLVRLLFAGLWCIADREGRLEDRPLRIKVDVLPYDRCHIDQMLQALHDHGFIHRYTVNDSQYIQVLTFTKHQNPHIKEGPSTIPAPVEHGASTVLEPDEHHAQHRASTMHSTSLARLVLDSGLPVLDSGLPLSKTSVVETPTIDARANAANNTFLKEGKSKPETKPAGRWDATEAGIDAKGRELGIPPKPGLDYFQYARVLWAAINERSRNSAN